MFGGTLPAKTTAVAYSIRCSRRRENSFASAGLTSGPCSLISVWEPLMGSTMAVEVRECPSISTRSKGMAASERPSLMASPLRPPANPAARTGTPRVRSERATLTPFPPASVTLSGALWRCPSVRLGTTSVRATAAFRVTVKIMTSTFPLRILLLYYPADGIPHPLPQRGPFVPPPGHQRALPDNPPVHLHDDLPEPRAGPRGVGRILHHRDLPLDLGARVHEALDVPRGDEVDALVAPVGNTCARVLLTLEDKVGAVVGGERVLEGADGGGEAVLPRVKYYERVPLIPARGRGDKALPRRRRGSGLHARGRRIREEELVGVGEGDLAVRRCDCRVLGRDHLAKLRVLHGDPRHPRQVRGTRVVAAGVEAHGVLEARVFETHLLGLLVHHPDEPLHAPVAYVLGKGVGGVVARGDHGRHQELPGAEPVSRQEAHVAVGRDREGRGLLGDGHLLVEVRLEGHERPHDLCGRRHRQVL